VGRKLADGGAEAMRLIDEVEVEAGAEAARAARPELAQAIWQAAETLRETTEWMLAQPINDRFAGAVPFLEAFALVLGGHFHLCAALAEGVDGPHAALARVFVQRLLPGHIGLCQQARAGAAGLYALSDDDLGAR